jgi:hypothetical protein
MAAYWSSTEIPFGPLGSAKLPHCPISRRRSHPAFRCKSTSPAASWEPLHGVARSRECSSLDMRSVAFKAHCTIVGVCLCRLVVNNPASLATQWQRILHHEYPKSLFYLRWSGLTHNWVGCGPRHRLSGFHQPSGCGRSFGGCGLNLCRVSQPTVAKRMLQFDQSDF